MAYLSGLDFRGYLEGNFPSSRWGRSRATPPDAGGAGGAGPMTPALAARIDRLLAADESDPARARRARQRLTGQPQGHRPRPSRAGDARAWGGRGIETRSAAGAWRLR